jgi:hypothetical protein
MLQAVTIALFLLAGADPQTPADTQPAATPPAQTQPAEQTTPTPTTTTAANDDNEVHCHTVRATGTLIGRRVCATRRQERERAEHDRQAVEDMQNRPLAVPAGVGQ